MAKHSIDKQSVLFLATESWYSEKSKKPHSYRSISVFKKILLQNYRPDFFHQYLDRNLRNSSRGFIWKISHFDLCNEFWTVQRIPKTAINFDKSICSNSQFSVTTKLIPSMKDSTESSTLVYELCIEKVSLKFLLPQKSYSENNKSLASRPSP